MNSSREEPGHGNRNRKAIGYGNQFTDPISLWENQHPTLHAISNHSSMMWKQCGSILPSESRWVAGPTIHLGTMVGQWALESQPRISGSLWAWEKGFVMIGDEDENAKVRMHALHYKSQKSLPWINPSSICLIRGLKVLICAFRLRNMLSSFHENA